MFPQKVIHVENGYIKHDSICFDITELAYMSWIEHFEVAQLFLSHVGLLSLFQYLHYTGIGVQPAKSPDHDYYILNPDDLPHIINPIEAFLGEFENRLVRAHIMITSECFDNWK